MRKYLVLLLIIFSEISLTKAQTVADFVFLNVCFGDSVTLSSTSTSTNTILQINWDIDSNGAFTDATGATVKWLFPVYKTYVVGIQVISNADTDVVYKQVSMYPVPKAAFDIDFPRQCLSNFFTYTNKSTIASGTMTYFWDLGNGITTNTATDTTATYGALGDYNVKLVATSDNGCKDSITKVVTIVPKTEADFTINDTDQCLVGNSFLFSGNSILCDAQIFSSWDLNGDGTFGDSNNVDPLTHIFTTPGTYKIGYMVITTSDTDSVYKFVNVYPSPAVSFGITSDSGQCLSGNLFTFSNSTVLGGTGTLSYFWSFGDGGTSTATLPLPYTYATTGSYIVKLVATSDKGCKDSAVVTARIYDQPSVDFSITDTMFCYTDIISFTNQSTIPSPWTLSYVWDFGDGSTSTSTNPSYGYVTAGTYNVKLIATSDSNCTDSVIKKIYLFDSTQARMTVIGDTQCLNGNTFTFTEKSVSCTTIVSTFWDLNNDGKFDDASTPTVNYSFPAAGTYNVGLKVITPVDSDSIYYTVVVLPSPVAAYVVNDSTQDFTGNNFLFNNASTPLASLTSLWDFGDGFTATSTHASHSYAAVGNYPVKLIVTHTNGCQDSVIHLMQVYSPIEAGFIANAVCSGDSMVFIDTSKSGSPIVQIEWDFNADLVFDTIGSTIKYKFPGPGGYLVGMKVTSTTTYATVYKMVTVYSNPAADFTYSETCQNSLTKFNDASTAVDPIVKYYWDFDNNGTVDDSSGKTPSKIFSTAGVNLVKLTVVTNKNCKSFVIKGVKVNFQPNADFTAVNVCDGDSVSILNNTTIVSDTILNFLWNYGDGSDGIILYDHKHLYQTAGSYTIRLIALTTKGCRDTATKIVTVYNKPALTLRFNGPTTFYDGYDVTITANGTFDSTIWSHGPLTPAVTVNQTGVYKVRVVDSNGCQISDSAVVKVIKVDKFVAVDVITPNGDNINDYWIIRDLGYYSPVELTIFNRYGDVIYNSKDYKNDWDGTRDGKEIPEGAYYYVVKTKQNTVFRGTINILR
ncbi:MAG TPA: PKD domain-containing protein [Bacteroidia bacterium]|nr:PKD domain-containing protein [Bacteroidia bacterium]HRS59783.1 PKD domain-containing protein [Bacteroidia bacterium]HRU68747.1 PKD domain-containing protein [Bacteroidia bacterium]